MASRKRKQEVDQDWVPPGPKAPAPACAAGARAAAPDAAWCVKCTRETDLEEISEEMYVDCYGEEVNQVEQELHKAAVAADGTWFSGKPDGGGSACGGSGGTLFPELRVFSTLEDANARVAKLWQHMLKHPPRGFEPVGQSAAPQPGDRSVSTDGRVRFSRTLDYYFDPYGSDGENSAASSITVEVVRVRRGWVPAQ